MAEQQQENAYQNPRYIRDKFLEVRFELSELKEGQRRHEERLDRHDQIIDMLVTVLKGNAEIQHSGLIDKMGQIDALLASIKATQEASERERQAARERAEAEKVATQKAQRDRYKWVGLGIALAAVPGVKEIVDIIQQMLP